MFQIVALIIMALAPLARAESLARLEEITARARDLDEFLANTQWVNEYYGALKEYYGKGKIPRGEFDTIVADMRKLSRSTFGFRERIWETTNLGEPVVVTSEGRSHGRDFNSHNWGSYWGGTYLPSLAALDSAAGSTTDTAALLKRVKEAEAAFRTGLAGKTLKQADLLRQRAEFYSNLRKDPFIRRSVGLLLREALTKEEILSNADHTSQSDTILSLLKDMHQDPRHHFAGLVGDSETLVSIVKDLLPDTKTLLDRKETFPPRTRPTNSGKQVEVGGASATNYVFRPIPRRFHGVWKGIPLGECIRTSCKRWSSILAKDSHLYHLETVDGDHPLERPGNYMGFVHLVPQRHQATGAIVASIDYGAPAMRSPIAIKTEDGGVRYVPLHEAWLAKASATLPKEWQGLAINGAGSGINNAKVHDVVVKSEPYTTGVPFGMRGDFVELDAMELTVPRMAGSGENMVFELRYNSNGGVTVLNPYAIRTQPLTDAEVIAALKRGGIAAGSVVGHLNARPQPLSPESLAAARAVMPGAAYGTKLRLAELLLSHGDRDPRLMDEAVKMLIAHNYKDQKPDYDMPTRAATFESFVGVSQALAILNSRLGSNDVLEKRLALTVLLRAGNIPAGQRSYALANLRSAVDGRTFEVALRELSHPDARADAKVWNEYLTAMVAQVEKMPPDAQKKFVEMILSAPEASPALREALARRIVGNVKNFETVPHALVAVVRGYPAALKGMKIEPLLDNFDKLPHAAEKTEFAKILAERALGDQTFLRELAKLKEKYATAAEADRLVAEVHGELHPYLLSPQTEIAKLGPEHKDRVMRLREIGDQQVRVAVTALAKDERWKEHAHELAPPIVAPPSTPRKPCPSGLWKLALAGAGVAGLYGLASWNQSRPAPETTPSPPDEPPPPVEPPGPKVDPWTAKYGADLGPLYRELTNDHGLNETEAQALLQEAGKSKDRRKFLDQYIEATNVLAVGHKHTAIPRAAFIETATECAKRGFSAKSPAAEKAMAYLDKEIATRYDVQLDWISKNASRPDFDEYMERHRKTLRKAYSMHTKDNYRTTILEWADKAAARPDSDKYIERVSLAYDYARHIIKFGPKDARWLAETIAGSPDPEARLLRFTHKFSDARYSGKSQQEAYDAARPLLMEGLEEKKD